MKTLLILYHSLTGGTEAMARAAFEGAEEGAALEGASTEAGVTARVIMAAAAVPEDLIAADGVIFACPENLASMAGVMKDFFDRSYYPALGRIEGRPYATMICAGSDGEGAARQIARIATGWRLKAMAEPLIICTHAQTPEAIFAPKTIPADALARCRDLGQAMAAGLSLGVF